MFTWFAEKMKSLFEWLYDACIAPIWTGIKSFLGWVVALVMAVVAFVGSVVDFIVQLINGLISGLTSLLTWNTPSADWGSASTLLNQANTFAPVAEFFSLLSATLVLWGIALTVRGYKWLRELIAP